MKSLLSMCSITLLMLVTVSAANADIAKPKSSPVTTPTRPALNTSLEIVPDPKAYDARLQIQESDLRELRAALDGTQGNTTIAAAITRSSTRTIIAGLLLFLSLSSAGVWLARSGRVLQLSRGRKIAAGIVMVAVTVGVAAIVSRGNAGPPSSFYWRNLPKALSQGRATTGGVRVEIVPDDPNRGRYMKLIIPLRDTSKTGEDE